ncbi:MAG TPA: tetratricopeptide repeat protein [Gemmataceae bacterium]|nr:tetratricopeptide repeat protein [Gemmataceae bacterium]
MIPTNGNNEPKPLTRNRRRRSIGLAVVILTLLSGGAIWWHLRPATPTEPPFVPLQGLEKPVARAIERAEKQVRESPRSGKAWGRLGMLLGGHGFRPQASECFAMAERLDPLEPRWPYFLGLSLQLDGLEDEAIPPLRRAVQLCPREPDAPRLHLAELLVKHSQNQEAEGHFRALLEARSDHAPAHLGMARLALSRGDLEGAREQLQGCLVNPSTRKAAHLLLAEVQQHRGDAPAARQTLRQAAAYPPDTPWPDPYQGEIEAMKQDRRTRVEHALQMYRRGQVQEMQPLLEELESDYPGTNALLRGRQLLDAKDYKAAEGVLREAVRLAPDFPQPHFWLGVALLQQQDVKSASACFREVIQLQPRHAGAYEKLAQCLEQMHDRPGAIEALETAVRQAPQKAALHRQLGALLASENRKDEALIQLRQALSLQPDDAKTRQLLEQTGKAESRKP